jgi:hypothetical protein
MSGLRVALLALAIGGCAWQQVPVEVNPSSITNPAAELRALMNQAENPPAQIEITDTYVKGIWVYSGGAGTMVLVYRRIAEVEVIKRDEVFQVTVYDRHGKQLWAWRPVTRDLESCERMVSTLYALSKKPVPSRRASRASVD